jgi:hypothetical protein
MKSATAFSAPHTLFCLAERRLRIKRAYHLDKSVSLARWQRPESETAPVSRGRRFGNTEDLASTYPRACRFARRAPGPLFGGAIHSAVGSGVLRIATRARIQHCAGWPGHVLSKREVLPRIGSGVRDVPCPAKTARDWGSRLRPDAASRAMRGSRPCWRSAGVRCSQTLNSARHFPWPALERESYVVTTLKGILAWSYSTHAFSPRPW